MSYDKRLKKEYIHLENKLFNQKKIIIKYEEKLASDMINQINEYIHNMQQQNKK